MLVENITYNPSYKHNPTCDILSYQIDKDTSITYGVYVKNGHHGSRNFPINIGDEFMEVYTGGNYCPESTKRSYSRCYYEKVDKLPKDKTLLWFQLRNYYNSVLKTK